MLETSTTSNGPSRASPNVGHDAVVAADHHFRDLSTLIKDISSMALDPLARATLHAIANDGGWRIGGRLFVNYVQLVRAYGVPDSPESLLDYLRQ